MGNIIDLNFINDSNFKKILERDLLELGIALENNAYKSVLILSGSILEAILVIYLTEKKKLEQLEKKNLNELIEMSYKEGLIDETTKNISSVIKDYRNLIHPGKETRNLNYLIDKEHSNIANSLLIIILNLSLIHI